MVAHNAERLGNRGTVPVVLAGKLRDFAQNIFKQVGIVHALFTGEHADGALQPHAGIHVLLRQRHVRAFLRFVVLHKHVVPDFQIPAAGAGGGAIRAAGFLIGDDEHFAVRAAGAGQARGAPPVVFLRQEEDMVVRHAAVPPELSALFIARGVLVARENGKSQLFFG